MDFGETDNIQSTAAALKCEHVQMQRQTTPQLMVPIPSLNLIIPAELSPTFSLHFLPHPPSLCSSSAVPRNLSPRQQRTQHISQPSWAQALTCLLHAPSAICVCTLNTPCLGPMDSGCCLFCSFVILHKEAQLYSRKMSCLSFSIIKALCKYHYPL